MQRVAKASATPASAIFSSLFPSGPLIQAIPIATFT